MLSAQEYQDLVAAHMSEEVLQRRVVDIARSCGWLAYHTYDSRRSVAGFPDLVLVHAAHGTGRVLFRELKTMKGRVSTAQKRWIDKLAVAGADVAVWRPEDLLSGAVVADLVVQSGGAP